MSFAEGFLKIISHNHFSLASLREALPKQFCFEARAAK